MQQTTSGSLKSSEYVLGTKQALTTEMKEMAKEEPEAEWYLLCSKKGDQESENIDSKADFTAV